MSAQRRNLQQASQSRVYLIEDRAAPNHKPTYETLARMTGVSISFGDITPVRVPDPKQYGRYIVLDTIQGQPELPTTSLEFRGSRDKSTILAMARKGCAVDVQLHIGSCEDPSDFDGGWEKILAFEGAHLTTYSTDDLGTFDGDGNKNVMETVDIKAEDMYEILPMGFGAQAESTVVMSMIDVTIADTKVCGSCGIASDGCQKVFALQIAVGASPGIAAEVVYTANGGASFGTSIITSLPVNFDPTALEHVGPYLVAISHDDNSINYALTAAILTDTEAWARVATGLITAGKPNAIVSVARDATWIAGDGGYIYKSEDITGGAVAQTSGDVTAQNLKAISAFDDNSLLAGGVSNAILVTRNAGVTWSLISGPSAKAGVTINAVAMLTELEWLVGYDDGALYYTGDGGVTWTAKALPGSLTHIDAIEFPTRTVGYISGRIATSTTPARILRTISGGYSWYVVPETEGLTVPSAAKWNGLASCGEDVNLLWAAGIKLAAGDGILVKGAA